jgi:histidinol dehydrogenase
MRYVEFPVKETWPELFQRPRTASSASEEMVKRILDDVAQRGDDAIKDLTSQIDGVKLQSIRASSAEIAAAKEIIKPELGRAIKIASDNIRKFHRFVICPEDSMETMPGIRVWRKSVPIESVGLYIPGGTAPLFSTVLMLAIPAVIAGCKRIVLCTPPDKNGNINPAILYAANECGVTEIYKIGGAQAIAAMRYGTQTILPVHKIFGPGNSWVTMAKQLIAKDGFPIDMPAGPSELAVFADESVDPAFVAADLLSQCEHGPDSQVVLVSTSKKVIDDVRAQTEVQLAGLLRNDFASKSLANSLAILVKTPEQGIELLNEYAPEHLILACNRAELLSTRVVNAGSVFIGQWSPESAGDYATGTNHTLPTSGNAKGWSGVSVDSFVKKITFQQLTKEGLSQIAGTVEVMAEAEGLMAHRNAVTIRMKQQ